MKQIAIKKEVDGHLFKYEFRMISATQMQFILYSKHVEVYGLWRLIEVWNANDYPSQHKSRCDVAKPELPEEIKTLAREELKKIDYDAEVKADADIISLLD